jgi:hypothetical protein
MKPSAWIRKLLPALTLAAAAANAGVVVSFADADRFSDARPDGYDRSSALGGLESHLQDLGQRYLPPQQTLRIEVLDVDLAGQLEMTNRGYQVRVLRDTGDGPAIRLRYTLEAGGKVLDSGEETLSDRAYVRLRRSINTDGAALYYEKRLLDEWFKSRFVQRARQ